MGSIREMRNVYKIVIGETQREEITWDDDMKKDFRETVVRGMCTFGFY
jgi:hypothetical protein